MGVQQVLPIKLSDLVLWSENPRDSITVSADNQAIADLALQDTRSKWSLKKLAIQMGAEFDFSELPTVVYHDKTPIVYDGNRRVILGLLSKGLVTNNFGQVINYPFYPDEIPCNVCDQKTALEHILRKHADTGSWSPLDRDRFLNKFMGQEKSTFLLLDELTGLISSNPLMNQGFVRDEILSPGNLEKLGFKRDGKDLLTRYDGNEAFEILSDLTKQINDEVITTRKKRGNPLDALGVDVQNKIEADKNNPYKPLSKSPVFQVPINPSPKKRTRRVKTEDFKIFGGNLYLKAGDVNNLYRDIQAIYEDYLLNPRKFSAGLPALIRMSLRLLVELAASNLGITKFDNYIKTYFSGAKSNLDQETATFLSNHNVKDTSLIALLQNGAHAYQSSSNKDQTIAISIIVGSMLSITHGK